MGPLVFTCETGEAPLDQRVSGRHASTPSLHHCSEFQQLSLLHSAIQHSRMAAALNPFNFPHIFESVIVYAGWDTQLSARLVYSTIRNIVDPLLSSPMLPLETDEHGNLKAINLDVKRWPNVPYFHPDGDAARQYAAVRRATKVLVSCKVATPRLNDLLQHILPTCRVSFRHHPGLILACDISIPRCISLELHMQPACDCPKLSTGTFRHRASTMTLLFKQDPVCPGSLPSERSLPVAKGRCPLADGALNGGVRQLVIGGNVRPLFQMLDRSNTEINPKLRVTISQDYYYHGITKGELASSISAAFDLPAAQVTDWSTWKSADSSRDKR